MAPASAGSARPTRGSATSCLNGSHRSSGSGFGPRGCNCWMSTELAGDRPAAGPPGVEPMAPRRFRVRRVTREIHDTVTLDIEPSDQAEEFLFSAGQFNMLYLFGLGEVPISISSDPAHPRVLAHTVRAVGPVTNALCRLKRGQMLGVRGPFGGCWPLREAVG